MVVGESSSQALWWQAIGSLRTEVHPGNRAAALAALIYLRWADFQDAEQEAIAAFDDTDYRPVLPASLHWRSWYRLPSEPLRELLAGRLPRALEGLSNARHDALATHLHRIAPAVRDLACLSSGTLEALIRRLAEQPFETPNDRRALLVNFDLALEKVADRSSGQFRTPLSIARLLVELAAPAAGDRIYDPCFGSAGLLTSAYEHVLRREKDPFRRGGEPLLTVSGVERNADAYTIGLTRLALAGIAEPQLELGNSLERTPPNNTERDGFDLVLCNPPWGMRLETAGLDHYPLRSSDATAMFLQHALAQLAPKGRAVVVVPQGFLSRGGTEQGLRRMLTERYCIESVTALPETVFLPNTAVRGNILVLRREGPTTRIRMADAEPWFAKGKGLQPATLSMEKAEELAKALCTPETSEHCWDVDVATLAPADWDLTPRRRDRSGLSAILESLQGKMEVVPLKGCCRVVTRKALKKGQLLDSPLSVPHPSKQTVLFPEHRSTTEQKSLWDRDIPSIPYVRIGDIRRGYADQGSSWLSPEAAETVSVDAKGKLKAGDVLLSKSGTIGKVGLVRNGAVGAIASDGLFVLRPDKDRLDPHFLLAYLTSAGCRDWLKDKARGATILHISRQAIEELPVPVPPLPVQQRVVRECRESDVDAPAFLSKLLLGGEKDPIAEWIDKTIDTLPVETDIGGDALDLSALDRLASETIHFIKTIGPEIQSESPLAAWLLRFHEAISGLQGVESIPRGPGLLSVLQDSLAGLKDSLKILKGTSPGETKARELIKRIAFHIDKVCYVLLNDVRIVFSTYTGPLAINVMVCLLLRIINRGSLPLRNVHVSTNPDWGGGDFKYFPENSEEIVALNGTEFETPGFFTLKVELTGTRLDGQSVSCSREIAFDVMEASSVTAHEFSTDLGSSPYVCGTPVRPDRDDVFFGRDELMERIRRQVVESGNVVLLEGNRRTGKSSILWHLEGPNAVPGWMGIYCSLQGTEGSGQGAGIPTAEVFRAMASSLAQGLRKLDGECPLPDGSILTSGRYLGISKAVRKGIGEESPFTDFRDYLEVVLERLERHKLGLLLMLDEFDKLQEGIDSGITSPQVPENIRFLIHQYPRFSAILTGSHIISRLRDEYWSALFGLCGMEIRVSFLPEDAARRLIVEPVRNRLVYSEEAVNRMIHLTSGQPYLLQCLCNRIFSLAADLKTRSITIDLVKQACDLLTDGNKYLGSLWEFAGSHRRRLILALAQRASAEADDFRFRTIQERLLDLGVEVDEESLIADLTGLRDLELIKLHGESQGGCYTLTIPLLGDWVDMQQDLSVIVSKARLETEDQHG